jgi:hypothetical protein
LRAWQLIDTRWLNHFRSSAAEASPVMATVKQDFTAKFQTSKDTDMEETAFHAGDTVTVVQTWDKFFLIKDENNHYYNVGKDNIEE